MKNILYLACIGLVLISCNKKDIVDEPISIDPVTWTDVGCEEEIIFSGSDLPFICLQWNAVNHAEEYVIYYSEAFDGTFTELARTINTRYENSELEANKSYFFYVKANNNSIGFGERSSIKERKRINALPVVRWFYDTGGGFCDLSFSGYAEYFCLAWGDSYQDTFIEEYVVYWSEQEEGPFVELVRIPNDEGINIYEHNAYDGEYGKYYYFKLKAYSSTYGLGPDSEVQRNIRSRKVTVTDLSGNFPSGYSRIYDFDFSSSSLNGYFILDDDRKVIKHNLTDVNSNTEFAINLVNPRKIYINSLEEVYVAHDNGVTKYDNGLVEVQQAFISGEVLGLNKENSTLVVYNDTTRSIEVYDTNLNNSHQFVLSTDILTVDKKILGDDNQIYIISGDKIFVYTIDGTLLNEITDTSHHPNSTDMLAVDNEGFYLVQKYGTGGSTFLYGEELVSNRFVINYKTYDDEHYIYRFDGNVVCSYFNFSTHLNNGEIRSPAE